MKRTPKETESGIDLLKPYTPSKPSEDDCFGHMWDPQHKDCAMCASSDVCGILYQQIGVLKAKGDFEKAKGPTLDETDFSRVKLSKFEKLAAQYEKEGELPITLEELYTAIRDLARTKDDTAVREFLNRELPKTKLAINENNEVYVKNSNSSRS